MSPLELASILASEITNVPPNSREQLYQEAFQRKLKESGVGYDRPRLPGSSGGYGQVDLLVHTIPPTLVEIKSSGDWRCVAQAGAALIGYAGALLDQRGMEVTKLAVFGGSVEPVYLSKFLKKLDIEPVCRP